MNPNSNHPAIQKYLGELEIASKQRIGIIPDQVISDAREHLVRDLEALIQAEPGLRIDELYDHFVQSYGLPDVIADAYAEGSSATQTRIPGFAPGWRISCPKCGRSAPAAAAGMTRIGARSVGKRVLGWCSECRWPRLLRVTRDLNVNTLVVSKSSKRLSVLSGLLFFCGLITVISSGTILLVREILADSGSSLATTQNAPQSKALGRLPDGWFLKSETEVNALQLNTISRKFSVPLRSLYNTTVEWQGNPLQINTVTAKNADDGPKLRQVLQQGKSNRRWVVLNGNTVYEFVVRNTSHALLASRARYFDGIQPRDVTYQVEFSVLPVKAEKAGAAVDQRNQFFNQVLNLESSPGSPEHLQQINELSVPFELGSEIRLVGNDRSAIAATWQSDQAVERSRMNDDQVTVLRFDRESLSRTLLNVTGQIRVNTREKRSVSKVQGTESLLSSNTRFPADQKEIMELARSITEGADSERDKVERLLQWFTKSDNIRYDGLMGARYGTQQVCQQRFGRCWDYSDLFISLCRAAGIPARQVYGWLYDSEGHVWCDVLIEGEWIMVDPTTGTTCGSDYIPLSISESGEMDWLYTSMIVIKVNQ
ncbi:MAG: transglutaminase domain-containing protein [Planctomyces sp.]|nr:transglutaminase domain-containing protein [Planctomyces sp.]